MPCNNWRCAPGSGCDNGVITLVDHNGQVVLTDRCFHKCHRVYAPFGPSNFCECPDGDGAEHRPECHDYVPGENS